MEIKISNFIKIPLNMINSLNKDAYYYFDKSKQTMMTTLGTKNGILYIPRNIYKFIDNFKIKDIKFNKKYIEKSFDKDYQINKNFKLREAQEKIINKLFERYKNEEYDNIITLGTGGGKTAMLPYLLSKIKQKTLILVDLKLLQDQMYNSFKEFTDTCDIQVVTAKTDKVCDVNIATVQLLNRNKNLMKLFKNEIGVTILDEAHVVGAETIKNVVQYFPAKYRIGLSATPTRSDGLDEVLTDVFTNKIDGVKTQSLPIGIKLLKTFYNPYMDFKHYNDLIKHTTVKYLTKYIDAIIKYYVKENNKHIMLAINDIKLQNIYKNRYKKFGAEIINNKASKKEKDKILEEYQNGNIKILIGYKVLQKGINIPRMDVLVNILSATTKENIEQLLGRLNREFKGKEKAIYIDFLFFNLLRKQAHIKVDTIKKVSNKLDLKGDIIDIDEFIKNLEGGYNEHTTNKQEQ